MERGLSRVKLKAENTRGLPVRDEQFCADKTGNLRGAFVIRSAEYVQGRQFLLPVCYKQRKLRDYFVCMAYERYVLPKLRRGKISQPAILTKH